jgi:hypothetical protein
MTGLTWEKREKLGNETPHIFFDIEGGLWLALYKGWCVSGGTPMEAFFNAIDRNREFNILFRIME